MLSLLNIIAALSNISIRKNTELQTVTTKLIILCTFAGYQMKPQRGYVPLIWKNFHESCNL